jgi:glycosyltransferase involved in cell wall biosynthesis
MKYSILLPFYNRSKLLDKTLESYPRRDDIEILIGIDNKCTDEEKKDCKDLVYYSNHHVIKCFDIDNPGYNPTKIYNTLAKNANGTFYILTNPEIICKNNVIKGLDEEFDKNSDVYVVCAVEYKSGWYQHSVHNNRKLHFLSAISAKNYHQIGGFDEEYSKGISYDDDDFIRTIEEANIEVVLRDDVTGIHQEHDRSYIENNLALVQKNKQYYISKWMYV